MLTDNTVYGRSEDFIGSRLLKIRGKRNNLLLWENIDSGQYGVHLYEEEPAEWDDNFLKYNYFHTKEKAEDILKKVLRLINEET